MFSNSPQTKIAQEFFSGRVGKQICGMSMQWSIILPLKGKKNVTPVQTKGQILHDGHGDKKLRSINSLKEDAEGEGERRKSGDKDGCTVQMHCAVRNENMEIWRKGEGWVKHKPVTPALGKLRQGDHTFSLSGL